MKNKFSLSVVLNDYVATCDNCGKTPSLEFWRKARRDEREHLCFYLCADCLEMARMKLLSETKPS